MLPVGVSGVPAGGVREHVGARRRLRGAAVAAQVGHVAAGQRQGSQEQRGAQHLEI